VLPVTPELLLPVVVRNAFSHHNVAGQLSEFISTVSSQPPANPQPAKCISSQLSVCVSPALGKSISTVSVVRVNVFAAKRLLQSINADIYSTNCDPRRTDFT